MGRETIAMTCRYAHLAPADLLAAVESLVAAPSATKHATAVVVRAESETAIIDQLPSVQSVTQRAGPVAQR
jgi:hypothetical protein